jgi:hypothetical protein
MTDVSYLRQRGFRRWYERELARGHLQLVLLLLCALPEDAQDQRREERGRRK